MNQSDVFAEDVFEPGHNTRAIIQKPPGYAGLMFSTNISLTAILPCREHSKNSLNVTLCTAVVLSTHHVHSYVIYNVSVRNLSRVSMMASKGF